jgi:hypothetical protein
VAVDRDTERPLRVGVSPGAAEAISLIRVVNRAVFGAESGGEILCRIAPRVVVRKCDDFFSQVRTDSEGEEFLTARATAPS